MVYFISQPMRGRKMDEITAEREKVAGEIRMHDPEALIIDSILEGHDATTPLRSLGESIKLMSEADIIYFIKGWDEARGCRIEYQCACEYDKVMILETEGED